MQEDKFLKNIKKVLCNVKSMHMSENHPYMKHISNYEDLVTTREEVRAGFIAFALEKNRRSTPYIERAKVLKAVASTAKNPDDLLRMIEIQDSMLTAAGLSDKALVHLTEQDKKKAAHELIEKFLRPAGKDFVDELVFRYLLIQGDTLGGSMRNIVGALAMQKLTRTLLATLTNAGIKYQWIDNRSKTREWLIGDPDDFDAETNLKAVAWKLGRKHRVMVYNIFSKIVKSNIDIILLDAKADEFGINILQSPSKYVMLGELKGGIDPAGADEHWKTANSALDRIRTAFGKHNLHPHTLFIAAAIEPKMAKEIWAQLEANKISNAANLTRDTQIAHVCNWIIRL